MCMNPMGMRWMMDAQQGKPKPTNTAPGMIYMLCGATQRSNTNPSDKTSPAIPIGPHWMITWPFDASANGLPTTVRDKGAWVMFAGTPYAYLRVCGTPWEGNEYHDGDKAVWTMSYARHGSRLEVDGVISKMFPLVKARPICRRSTKIDVDNANANERRT
jgi:hypothetical protein